MNEITNVSPDMEQTTVGGLRRVRKKSGELQKRSGPPMSKANTKMPVLRRIDQEYLVNDIYESLGMTDLMVVFIGCDSTACVMRMGSVN